MSTQISPWNANISLIYSMQILFISSSCPSKAFWQPPIWLEWVVLCMEGKLWLWQSCPGIFTIVELLCKSGLVNVGCFKCDSEKHTTASISQQEINILLLTLNNLSD